MQKQCIYCPTEYTVPDGAWPQSPFGVCAACHEIARQARAQGEGAVAVVELAALAGDDPKRILAQVSLRGAA